MNDLLILKTFRKHIELGQFDTALLSSELAIDEIAKNEMLLQQGQACKKLYFVESGSLRAFNLNKDGKDSTIMFAVQDWWITDMYAFVNQKAALMSIEALETSRIVAIDYHQLQLLYKQIPQLERFFRILFQNAYVREQLRALDSISFTTEQRYQRFIKKYPQIVQKITQKQIASYLGVTPEFLSSIKKK